MENAMEEEVAVFVKNQREELERDEKDEVATGGSTMIMENPFEAEKGEDGDGQEDDKGHAADVQEQEESEGEQGDFVKPFRRIAECGAQDEDDHQCAREQFPEPEFGKIHRGRSRLRHRGRVGHGERSMAERDLLSGANGKGNPELWQGSRIKFILPQNTEATEKDRRFYSFLLASVLSVFSVVNPLFLDA